MHEVLVNRLGGLSLPRKSVVRLTDRPDMTLDVYRGRKTTMQQQQHQGSTKYNLHEEFQQFKKGRLFFSFTRPYTHFGLIIYSFLHCWSIQSTIVISKSKGPSEILRDIRTSTYQMCRTEENTNQTTKFHK